MPRRIVVEIRPVIINLCHHMFHLFLKYIIALGILLISLYHYKIYQRVVTVSSSSLFCMEPIREIETLHALKVVTHRAVKGQQELRVIVFNR